MDNFYTLRMGNQNNPLMDAMFDQEAGVPEIDGEIFKLPQKSKFRERKNLDSNLFGMSHSKRLNKNQNDGEVNLSREFG